MKISMSLEQPSQHLNPLYIEFQKAVSFAIRMLMQGAGADYAPDKYGWD